MKEYIVVLKSNPTEYCYKVEAPSKRVARWCAMNLFLRGYVGPAIYPNDFKAFRSNGQTLGKIEELMR